MTQPAPEPTPYDTGNPLLGGGPASIALTQVPTVNGEMTAATFRTMSTTLTAFLTREELYKWADVMRSHADQMGGLIVPQPGDMIPLQAVR